MEFVLRCNDLKCRTQLHTQAIVTTCSHVFCIQCSDKLGLSRAPNANRQCPACGSQLVNPDDVVISDLNPTEDYKTSVLSGMSPSIIMECASRGLTFYSYQASQEIIYQEHLAKNLTEKYATLNHQMDQIINDANSQIKVLQDRMQSMQAEQTTLEQKHHELADAFREKARALQHAQKSYQQLKAKCTSSHVANAAGDEADHTLYNIARASGDRFVDKIPGARMGTANYSSQFGIGSQQQGGGRQHNRADSRSSRSSGYKQQRSGIGVGPDWNPQVQNLGPGGRVYTSQPAPMGTPGGQHRSRLPVLGSTRQAVFGGDAGASGYQAAPINKQAFGVAKNLGGFGFSKSGKRASAGAVAGFEGR